MKIIVAGGTGFIGGALIQRFLEEGHQVVVLTRRPASVRDQHSTVHYEGWDGKSIGSWVAHFEGAGAVVNLAGESIADRWSAEKKRKIVESRVRATEIVVTALKQVERKPKVLISASAVGYYGDVPSGEVTAEAPPGKGFLAETSVKWERAALEAAGAGVRVTIPRIGIVLEKGGGALEKMVPPFQFFIGGPLGSGRQWMSWVHRDDLIGMIVYALQHSEVSGPFNATAPNPATMKEFSKTLGKVMKRPSWVPVPAFMLRLLLGEMADEMLLSGQKAVPKEMLAWGYTFRYPGLNDALAAIL